MEEMGAVAVGRGISPAAAPSAQGVKKVVICLIIIVDTNFTDLYLNFGNPKNSRSHPIISQIPKYRRLNPTQNRYQPTPRNILNFAFIPRCRGKVLSSHRTAAPRFSRF